MTATNPPTYSLLMWQRRQFSSEVDKMDSAAEKRCTGLKLTDSCVKVCRMYCVCVCVCVCVCACVRACVCVCDVR